MIQDKYLQVVAHFYRGEMNRMTVYRQRLDTTTQYTISLSSIMIIYYMSYNCSIYFPLFILFLIMFFCFLETRRYQYFLISQKRIKLLEEGFFINTIFNDDNTNIEWKHNFINNLKNTNYIFPFHKSFIIRYKRYYIWITDFILGCWLLKLYILKNHLIFKYILIFILIFQHSIFLSTFSINNLDF